MKNSFQRWLAPLLVLLVFSSQVQAQIPGLPTKAVATEQASTSEKPEETEARLQLWIKEARAALARLNEPGAETQLPPGVDSGALADHRRFLEQTILTANRHLKVLASMGEARKALDAARTANAQWTGFSEKPPFSILMLDELINQQDSIKDKLASYQSSLELFGRTLSGIQEEARLAEESIRRTATEAARNPSDDSATKWRITTDRAKSRVLALRATSLQSNVSLLQDQAETARIQLSLLDRQIAAAKKHSTFNEEELTQVRKAAADRQAMLRKEIAATRKLQQDALANRARLQAALDSLLKPTTEGAAPQPTPDLSIATLKVEAAETRVEALQFIAETLESLSQLESFWPDNYQYRKTLTEHSAHTANEDALRSLRLNYDRLTAWDVVAANELAAINADINKQESRANSIAAEDPRLVPINDQRAALWDKLAVEQRLAQSVSSQRRMLKRWLAEWDQSKTSAPLTETLSTAASSTWRFLKQIWTFVVFQYDDTVMIGGLPITEKRSVTLGDFFVAIFSFGIAYYILSRIKNRLQAAVVEHGYLAEAQARTLSNWLMILVGFLLAVATLHYLEIPLTIFAFLGGALVIGLGFGTQTLIKNFISGIIVLFERKIRVGDIVDVGGISGTITEINTRSSVLHGDDGKETLVPNSLFLENRVTNLTLANRRVRRTLKVHVALGSSPQEVSEILKACAERHGLILKEPAPIVTFEDFAENAFEFAIYYWTEFNDKTNANVVASDMRFMIEKGFAESGIRFPNTTPSKLTP